MEGLESVERWTGPEEVYGQFIGQVRRKLSTAQDWEMGPGAARRADLGERKNKRKH